MSVLFHEIPIGDTFGWRGSTWKKTDQTHAVPVAGDAEAMEHVPSHDTVLMAPVGRPFQADIDKGSAAT